jgi:hypothetical protein
MMLVGFGGMGAVMRRRRRWLARQARTDRPSAARRFSRPFLLEEAGRHFRNGALARSGTRRGRGA